MWGENKETALQSADTDLEDFVAPLTELIGLLTLVVAKIDSSSLVAHKSLKVPCCKHVGQNFYMYVCEKQQHGGLVFVVLLFHQ